jgi:hypothetical protein
MVPSKVEVFICTSKLKRKEKPCLLPTRLWHVTINWISVVLMAIKKKPKKAKNKFYLDQDLNRWP